MPDLDIKLSFDELGQLIEGLNVLIEQWEATEQFLTTGLICDDACIRKSHNAQECRCIASAYRAIRDRLLEQRMLSRHS